MVERTPTHRTSITWMATVVGGWVGAQVCACVRVRVRVRDVFAIYDNIILEWTTSLDTSSRTLFVR